MQSRSNGLRRSSVTANLLCSSSIAKIAVLFALLLFILGLQAHAATYALSVSTSSSRNGAVALQGATVSGNVYMAWVMSSRLCPVGYVQ